jgi:hypothetical protein
MSVGDEDGLTAALPAADGPDTGVEPLRPPARPATPALGESPLPGPLLATGPAAFVDVDPADGADACTVAMGTGLGVPEVGRGVSSGGLVAVGLGVRVGLGDRVGVAVGAGVGERVTVGDRVGVGLGAGSIVRSEPRT